MSALKLWSLVRAGLTATVVLLGSTAHADTITITISPSLGPNQSSPSPSFSGYSANAINGLMSGSSTQGNANNPTYYSTTNSITTSQMIVTGGFTSWMGQTNPGTVFGSNFANEYGNRLDFGVHIHDANGFSLSQLNGSITSTVGGGFDLDFSLSFDNTSVYSNKAVGVTANGTVINSGSATQTVTDLYYVGLGNAFEVDVGDYNDSNQNLINDFLTDPGNAAILQPFTITGSYWLTSGPGGTGSIISPVVTDVVQVNAVPEPATNVLLGVGLALLGAYRLRRRVVLEMVK